MDSLITAGLKASATSTDVVVASQSAVGAVLRAHLTTRRVVARLVAFLQQQPWVDVVFTRGGRQGQGSVPGTFSLDLTQSVARVTVAGRGGNAQVDIRIETRTVWRVRRRSAAARAGRLRAGPAGTAASARGWSTTAWCCGAVTSRARTRISAPASLADLMPTVLTLLAVQQDPCADACGRVLEESLKGSRDADDANAPHGDDEIRAISGPAPDLERGWARLR